MRFQEIIVITGQPGLYRATGAGKQSMVVQELGTTKRIAVSSRQQVGALSDISVYTVDDQEPLQAVFQKMQRLAEATDAPLPVPSPKAPADELRAYMDAVLPEHDRERVYTSVIQKLIKWYVLMRPHIDFLEQEHAKAQADLAAAQAQGKVEEIQRTFDEATDDATVPFLGNNFGEAPAANIEGTPTQATHEV